LIPLGMKFPFLENFMTQSINSTADIAIAVTSYQELLDLIDQMVDSSDTPNWLKTIITKHPLHPVIKAALDDKSFTLKDANALISEWPHVSLKEPALIAYTRNEEAAQANRVVPTKMARYLTKHFTNASSHEIRDLAVLFAHEEYQSCCFTEQNIQTYVQVVQTGPKSCMKQYGEFGVFKDNYIHPYSVYLPKFGWHMAIETHGTEIWGRCLCLTHKGIKSFVRSYYGDPKLTVISNTSTFLEAWLLNQGYLKEDAWPEGASLDHIEHCNDSIVAPYLDGNQQRVSLCYGKESYLEIYEYGDYLLNTINGKAFQDEPTVICEGCEDEILQSDVNLVGDSNEHSVCNHCLRNNYKHVLGCCCRTYFVLNERAVSTWRDLDTWYDNEYLDDVGLVQITIGHYEGECAKTEDTITDGFEDVWDITDVGVDVLLVTGECQYKDKYLPAENTWTSHIDGLLYYEDVPEPASNLAFKTLNYMLSVKRPHGGTGVENAIEFLQNHLPPKKFREDDIVYCTSKRKYAVDACGNLHVDARVCKNTHKTLFVAHLDTVHRVDGINLFDRKNSKISAIDAPLGADDGAGIAILMGLLCAEVPGYYVFTQGEEVGGIGAKYLREHYADLLLQFDRAIAFDRRNTTSIITHQGYRRCASDEFAEALSEQLNAKGLMMMPDNTGIYTDTAEWIDIIPECTNVSCGYFLEHTHQEWLDLNHFVDLVDAVIEIDWDSLPTARNPE
jgi:hypothetical protein